MEEKQINYGPCTGQKIKYDFGVGPTLKSYFIFFG